MSLLTAIETTLNNDTITTEMEEQLNETLWTRDFSDEEMTALHQLFEQLESNETQLVEAA